MVDATKLAIRQHDRRSLAAIVQRFDALLPWPWRVIARLLQNSLVMACAHTVLAVRDRWVLGG